MKRLYGTPDPIEAEVLRALLRDAGIESTLDNPNGSASSLGIDVKEEDTQAAVDVLARHFEKQQSSETPSGPGTSPSQNDEESSRSSEDARRALRPKFIMAALLLGSGALVSMTLAANGHGLHAGIVGGAVMSVFALVWVIGLLREGQ